MTGRRAIVGLSLLCALAFCAFAAANASAAGTTAFTCVKAEGGAGFSDEHCDNEVGSGAKFKHEAISVGAKTEIDLSNGKTASETTKAQPFILTGKLGGVNVEIFCAAVSGAGTLTNEEVEATMQTTGDALIEASECTVPGQPKCAVKNPIVWDAKFKTYGNETAMGLEFTPRVGTTFGSWTLTDNGANKCGLNGTFTIEGSFQATPGGTPQGKGATLTITKETSNNLKWGGNPYTLTGALTWRMKKEGNPITFTTN